MKITLYTNTRLPWFGLNSWKGSHTSEHCRQILNFFHTEEQSAALHVTYASGSKAHLGQLLNKEQMLNIKDAQLTMASFSLVIILPAGCSSSSGNAQTRTFSKKLKSQNPLQ